MDTPAEKSDPPQNAEPPAGDGSDGEQEAEDWGDEFNQMAPKAKAKAASRGKGRGRGKANAKSKAGGAGKKREPVTSCICPGCPFPKYPGSRFCATNDHKKLGTIWCIKEEAARASRRKSEARSMRP